MASEAAGAPLDRLIAALPGFRGTKRRQELVGITNGYCFAGNAVLIGTCDVVIATEGSNIGVGGPAMRLAARREIAVIELRCA